MNAKDFQEHLVTLDEEMIPLIDEWIEDTLAPAADPKLRTAVVHHSILPEVPYQKLENVMKSRGFTWVNDKVSKQIVINW